LIDDTLRLEIVVKAKIPREPTLAPPSIHSIREVASSPWDISICVFAVFGARNPKTFLTEPVKLALGWKTYELFDPPPPTPFINIIVDMLIEPFPPPPTARLILLKEGFAEVTPPPGAAPLIDETTKSFVTVKLAVLITKVVVDPTLL
jgi:hypothetical protein